MKRENLFINKEEKMHKNFPDAVSDSSIMLLLAFNLCTIQTMTILWRQFNNLT